MKLKETFSTIPELYDRARLDYPAALFRDILKFAHLKKNDPILEIGIGTGKATEPFARLGNPLLGNDLSRSLISVAKKRLNKYRNVQYKVGQFENAKLLKNKFGLIYSAQAFHWIKPSVRFTKTLSSLKPGGVLALLWNYNYYDRGIGKLTLQLHKKYSRGRGGKADAIINQLINDQRFTGAVVKKYHRDLTMTHQEYITMQTSFSWYLALSEKRLKQALDDLQILVNRYPDPMVIPIRTKLAMARKK